LARLIRTAAAEDDLVDIWLYIATDSPGAADRLLDRIDEACHLLASAPASAPGAEDLAPTLRHFVVGRYLVLYREITGSAEIVRVVRGARNLPDVF